MVTLRHLTCGHEWQVSSELADRVVQDINGGQGNTSPPIRCPACGVLDRYSRFDTVDEPPADG
jgi:hypothetical protein